MFSKEEREMIRDAVNEAHRRRRDEIGFVEDKDEQARYLRLAQIADSIINKLEDIEVNDD
jgi:hypothetical protein